MMGDYGQSRLTGWDRIGTTRIGGEMVSCRNGAQVAELVDALASGASGRKAVEVRVFSWVPN